MDLSFLEVEPETNKLKYAAPTNLPVRPLQHNKTGRDIAVKLNTWHVTKFPSKPVYQWDVSFDSRLFTPARLTDNS